MVLTEVTLSGLTLSNPVIAASGTFGYGREFAQIYDINCLGSFAFKGTTLEPRFGNAGVRVAECPSGMLNCVGLQNPGVQKVIDEELPYLRQVFHKPVIANVSGFSIDEYVATCAALDGQPQVGLIELNISCPNVHGGGMSFGTDPELAAQVVREVKRAVKKPLYVKLTPNGCDIASVAVACQRAGADGLSLINTLMGMRIDLPTGRPVLGNITGGLSGPAILPVALALLYQVYERVSIPIMGMGGVSCARDVVEMMLAGATAVQVGAANLVDPLCCKRIVDQLPGLLETLGVNDIRNIIGGAHTCKRT